MGRELGCVHTRLWNLSVKYIEYIKCTLPLYLQIEISFTVSLPNHILLYCQYHQSIKGIPITESTALISPLLSNSLSPKMKFPRTTCYWKVCGDPEYYYKKWVDGDFWLLQLSTISEVLDRKMIRSRRSNHFTGLWHTLLNSAFSDLAFLKSSKMKMCIGWKSSHAIN